MNLFIPMHGSRISCSQKEKEKEKTLTNSTCATDNRHLYKRSARRWKMWLSNYYVNAFIYILKAQIINFKLMKQKEKLLQFKSLTSYTSIGDEDQVSSQRAYHLIVCTTHSINKTIM